MSVEKTEKIEEEFPCVSEQIKDIQWWRRTENEGFYWQNATYIRATALWIDSSLAAWVISFLESPRCFCYFPYVSNYLRVQLSFLGQFFLCLHLFVLGIFVHLFRGFFFQEWSLDSNIDLKWLLLNLPLNMPQFSIYFAKLLTEELYRVIHGILI